MQEVLFFQCLREKFQIPNKAGLRTIINRTANWTGRKKCAWTAAAATKSLQSCPTLWDPIDGSPPGSPVPGILQARMLEWVAISFSNAWKWKVKVKSFSRARLLATPWTAAHQAPPPMGFSRQEYWSGVPLPSPVLGLDAVKSCTCEQVLFWECVHKFNLFHKSKKVSWCTQLTQLVIMHHTVL